jgi:gas vesicle protein
MAKDETADLVTAFLIGAALGIGATLLIRSEPESDAERILRQIGVARKRGAKRMRAAHSAVSDGIHAARERSKPMARAGRDALGGFRDEISALVDAARDEIVHTARDTVREARSALKRRRN